MEIGSVFNHIKHGKGKIKYFSEDKVIVDFGKFEITFEKDTLAELSLLE